MTTSNHNEERPIQTSLWTRCRTAGDFFALLFNTMFAVLTTVTLLGIIFITKPQQVMHNIAPDWWIPLAIIMIPSQSYCQFLSWTTVWEGKTPSPLNIAGRFETPPWLMRPAFAFLWFANFVIGFAIVVSLYKPDGNANIQLGMMLLIAAITFALTSFANVYLMLLVKAVSSNETVLRFCWRFRLLVDIAIAVAAVLYYRLIF